MSLQYHQQFSFQICINIFLSSFLSHRPCTFQTDAAKQKAYDQYTYIGGLPSDGGGGVAMGATICKSDKGERISFSRAPTTKDCKADKVKKCTKSYRLGVLAKVYYVVQSHFRHLFTPCSSHG